MGALHAGHAALIERARADSDFVVVSIFVNPIQFDLKEDYERYARTLPEDIEICANRGVDLIFAPEPEEMYPAPLATTVDVAGVSDGLCGAFRPGHFRGVATVVAKLFQIVQPDREDGVPATLGALFVIVKGANRRDEHVVDLVLSRATQDHRLSCDGAEAGVTCMLVRHGHETRLGAGDSVAGLRVRGIGEDDPFSTAHPEAGVSEPGHVHRESNHTRNRPTGGRV